MAKRASLDLETTGLEPAGAAVLSVGIVMFDVGGVYEEDIEVGFWRLDPRWTPGRRDRETHAWWEKQNAVVRMEAFGGTQLPWQFCAEFSHWISANDPDEVWCNPARFDHGHLRELFHQMGHVYPIDYRKERDLPTLKALAREKAMRRSAGELDALNNRIRSIYNANKKEHSALSDAIEQANSVRMLTEYINDF